MTEPVSMAAMAVSWLCDKAKSLGSNALRAGLNAAETRLLDWIEARLRARGGDAADALEAVCKDPDDGDECATLRSALKRVLKADAQAQGELTALLEAAAPDQDFSGASQTANVSHGGVSVQIQGKGNAVSGISTGGGDGAASPPAESPDRKPS